MRFSRDNPLGSVIGQKEFFLILTFDKEVQLGLKTWHDHPATTGIGIGAGTGIGTGAGAGAGTGAN
jgi:hypothetical protein